MCSVSDSCPKFSRVRLAVRHASPEPHSALRVGPRRNVTLWVGDPCLQCFGCPAAGTSAKMHWLREPSIGNASVQRGTAQRRHRDIKSTEVLHHRSPATLNRPISMRVRVRTPCGRTPALLRRLIGRACPDYRSTLSPLLAAAPVSDPPPAARGVRGGAPGTARVQQVLHAGA